MTQYSQKTKNSNEDTNVVNLLAQMLFLAKQAIQELDKEGEKNE